MRCEQLYDYSYVRKLRPLVKDVAPQRGTILHEYLSTFYSGLVEGLSAEQAHTAGHMRLLDYEKQLNVAVAAAFYAGQEELAADYKTLLAEMQSIVDRYFIVRGLDDSRRYDVLAVERTITAELVAGVTSRSIIDLVLFDRQRELTFLVEHKTTKNIPESALRIRDFQTLLYAEVLRRRTEITIDGVLWNYIRTKAPTVPEPLKSGGITRRKDIDTTWEVYSQAVRDLGRDPAEYEEMRERLEGREETVFFPRYEHVIVTEPVMLLEDYASVAKRVQTQRLLWANGVSRPVRSLTRDCDYCAYYRLCEAAITGGDEEDIIRMRFTTEKEERP